MSLNALKIQRLQARRCENKGKSPSEAPHGIFEGDYNAHSRQMIPPWYGNATSTEWAVSCEQMRTDL